jgi:hypothetical protein
MPDKPLKVYRHRRQRQRKEVLEGNWRGVSQSGQFSEREALHDAAPQHPDPRTEREVNTHHQPGSSAVRGAFLLEEAMS